MREILFRAKRSFNKKWVTGSLVMDGNMAYIIGEAESAKHINALVNGHTVNVIPATIGQFTGLVDKNGTKIFEGDIVDILTENEETGVIAYDDGAFVIRADGFDLTFYTNIYSSYVEVIGNIHDKE